MRDALSLISRLIMIINKNLQGFQVIRTVYLEYAHSSTILHWKKSIKDQNSQSGTGVVECDETSRLVQGIL